MADLRTSTTTKSIHRRKKGRHVALRAREVDGGRTGRGCGLRLEPPTLAAVADEHKMRPRREKRFRGAHQETVVLFRAPAARRSQSRKALGNTEAGPGLDSLGVVDLESFEIHAVVDHEQLVGRDVAGGPQRLHQRARAGDITMRDSGRAPGQEPAPRDRLRGP